VTECKQIAKVACGVSGLQEGPRGLRQGPKAPCLHLQFLANHDSRFCGLSHSGKARACRCPADGSSSQTGAAAYLHVTPAVSPVWNFELELRTAFEIEARRPTLPLTATLSQCELGNSKHPRREGTEYKMSSRSSAKKALRLPPLQTLRVKVANKPEPHPCLMVMNHVLCMPPGRPPKLLPLPLPSPL